MHKWSWEGRRCIAQGRNGGVFWEIEFRKEPHHYGRCTTADSNLRNTIYVDVYFCVFVGADYSTFTVILTLVLVQY
jgi:hypothetical protein